MWLVATALALPPGVCPPGLYPVGDGRCTGYETPWRASERGWGELVLAADGRAVFLGSVETDDGYGPAPTLSIDPGSGAMVESPAPFGESWPHLFASLPDGRVVALRGDDGTGAHSGVRWFGPSGWSAATGKVPGSVAGAGWIPTGEGELIFAGGLASDGHAAATAAWRWTPDTGRWTALPPLPVGRLSPVVFPGPSGPTVCGGHAARGRDAAPVTGCVALERGRWVARASAVEVGPQAEAVTVQGGVLVVDHGERTRAWFVDAAGTEHALPDPPAGVRSWTAGRGPRVAGLGEDGALTWLDVHTGAVEVGTPPGARGWAAGLAIPLAADRALYVGRLHPEGYGAGVVDAANPQVPGDGSTWLPRAAGGPDDFVRLDDVEVARWDPASLRFRALPSLPARRWMPAIVPLADGGVLVAGGRMDDAPTASALRLVDGAWRPVAPLPEPLQDATGVRLPDGDVVVAGVAGGVGRSFRYVVARDTWTPLALPVPGPGQVLAVPGGAVWLRDGEDDSVRGLARFVDGAWVALPPVPRVVTGIALVGLLDGTLVAAGGRTGNDYGGDAETWRLPAGATDWVAMPSLSDGRWGATLVALDGERLLLVGGSGPGELWDGVRWTVTAPLSIERRGPYAVPLDPTRVLVFGGHTQERGTDWEIYRVVGEPTDWPEPPLVDPRLAADPDGVGIGRRIVAAQLGCDLGIARACLAAAELWAAPPLSDAARAGALRARACALRGGEGCP